MTKTIIVSRGLCSAMRDDVLTALKPRGIRILAFDCWGEGHHHIPCPDFTPFPDADIWVKKHIAHITVSDAQQKWAEELLWYSGKVTLDSEPHPKNRHLNWTAPAECKAGPNGTLGRGHMPTPWSEKKRQAQDAGDLLGGLRSLFGGQPQEQPRRQRKQRRAKRQRRGR